jgi:cephalosporin-C deacetylase
MPVFEKPLDELRAYRGINPKPADFEAFWDAGLAELKAVDPAPELRPSGAIASEAAECFDLWFTGVGGSRIHAKYLRPRRAQGRRPAVLQFHGYSGNSGGWVDKLAYASEGICLAAMDCRGQGGLSEDLGSVKGNTLRGHVIRGLDEDDPRRMLFRSVFLDTAQLARVVASFPEVDPHRMGAMGASQGGALTLACAALVPGIRRAAPVYPFLCDYRRVWDMDLAKDTLEEMRLYLRLFDPRHERIEAFFTKLGYIDCQHLAPRIRAETLWFLGMMDTICPPSSQFAAYNRIGAKKDMVIYPDFGHEALPDQPDRTFAFMRGL